MTIPSPILIIGGGTMGSAIAGRWRKEFPKTTLHVVEPDAVRREGFAKLGCTVHASLAEVKAAPAIVLLAVKPQSLGDIENEVAALAGKNGALVISILAGVPLSRLSKLSPLAARVMPNTPSTIGEGISAIAAPGLSEKTIETVKELFGALGSVVIVDEKDMHAVTAISGSGPAYLFAFAEALIEAGKAQGLTEQLSRTLVIQTLRGAALLADSAGGDVKALREAVTSKAGTTETALKIFTEGKLTDLVKAAVAAASSRSKELSGQ